MTFISYNPNIPFATNNPSDDQPKMLTNTNSVNTWVTIDHHGFEDPLGGYHNIIHQDSQLVDPVAIPLINQTYTKTITPDTTGGLADTQLFIRSALGNISQLTGNFSNVQGYQWIGGVLLMWGKDNTVITSGLNGTTLFKDRTGANSTIPFANNCFIVITSPTTILNPSSQLTVAVKTVSKTAFTWLAVTNSSAYNGFYWIAIGN